LRFELSLSAPCQIRLCKPGIVLTTTQMSFSQPAYLYSPTFYDL
jgi:hypothetical protein